MKRIILIVSVLLVASAVLGGLTVAVYSHYRDKIKNQPTPAATITVSESNKKLEAAKKEADAKYNGLVYIYNMQVGECNKGKIAYEKLSTALKSTTSAPVCNTGV